MNVGGRYFVDHPNASQPQQIHAYSRQSVTPSDEFYSLSECASSVGDDEDEADPNRPFITPPSRKGSPDEDQLQLQPEGSEITARRSQRSTFPAGAILKGKQLRRKPVASPTSDRPRNAQQPRSSSSYRRTLMEEMRGSATDPLSPSTTPGIDETPYIRFAIDQLTRDEEVRGSRRYTGRDAYDDEIEDYPVERIVPEVGLGYVPSQKERDMARQKEMQAGNSPKHPLHGRVGSSSSVVQYDVFVPYSPPVPTNRHPRLNFLPGILRPLWLGTFIFICILMLVGLILSATWSLTHDGLWRYVRFGDNRYFVFEYLPTLLGMIILVWLFQIQIAVQRIFPFIAMASHSTKSRSEGSFLHLYPTQFILPNLQSFRAEQPIIGSCFCVFWSFLFTIPLLASSFNVRFFGPVENGTWRWVAVQGVIWTVVALYILLIVTLVVLAFKLRKTPTGLKWDSRSLADIISLLERANVTNDYVDTEILQRKADFKQRLWNRTDRLGYWHTSRQPQDIFYGLGEEGGAIRRYSLEQGRIREKVPQHSRDSSRSSLTDLEAGAPRAAADYSIRSDIRDPAVRRRYMPWFLSSSAVLAWILVAFVLLIAFYVVAFVNRTSERGFLPQLTSSANSAGFSPANFLYSFLPCTLGLILFLLWLPLDYAHRRLAPFAAMSAPRGATAEKSLLLDYPFALPLSITLAAASNGHWKVALLSALSIINITIPVLSGGIFWAQWYPGENIVRIAAHPAGLYALCFFLALYTVSLLALVPGRNTVALPHDAKCLAEIVSWLYMSPLLCDKAFANCNTKAELVGRLVGHQDEENVIEKKPSFWASVTNLVTGGSRNASRATIIDDNVDNFGEGPSTREKRLSTVPEDRSLPRERAKILSEELNEPVISLDQEKKARRSKYLREEIRYGFGVFMGRDGKEHLGVERVLRRGREMVLFEDGNTKRRSWIGW